MNLWKKLFGKKDAPAPQAQPAQASPAGANHVPASNARPVSPTFSPTQSADPHRLSSPDSPPSRPGSEYDLFISYAHQGDTAPREAVTAMVARLHDALESDFRRRFERDLEIFFDKEDIQDFDHWQVRCHRALRSSRFFLAFLSRSFLRSDACRWEWEEWCKHEVEYGLVGQGAASLWFVRMEDLDAPEDAELLRRWQGDLLQRFHIQCHEWKHDQPDAFLDAVARNELARLTDHVAQRLRNLITERARQGNLPWPNANFVGREPELAWLRDALVEAPSASPVGLHGVGGMGKTALAQAFAHREAGAFPGGCWLLRCEGRASLLTLFRSLVPDLEIELTEEEMLDDAAAVRRVFDLLRPRGPALFLLDNVDQPALLAPDQLAILSDQPWARLLYSTRQAPAAFTDAGAGVRPMDLDRLPEDQAVALIRRYQPGQAFSTPGHEAAAREVVGLLSGLTLAVETAAVYLGQSDPRLAEPQHAVDLRSYVDTLRADLHRGSGEGVMSQLREVTATLHPTLDRLDAPTRTVLQCSALLGPDAIALPWLRALAGGRHPELAADAATGQSDPWTQLVRSLLGMRLFLSTPEPRVVTVHRILQRVLETTLREDRATLETALIALVRERAAVLEKETKWEKVRWELEPLEALAWHWAEPALQDSGGPAEPTGSPRPPAHEDAAWLLSQTGVRRHDLAEWSLAEPLMRRALAIDEASFGPDHPNVAIRLNNLATLLQCTNRLAEAEPLMRRALAIDEASFGPDHPEVATRLNNLAQLLKATNRLAEAEPLMRRALAIDEASFGRDHPDVATGLINLAALMQATNRLAEAEPLYRRALAIDEASFGQDHRNVARDLNNLAALLEATNRLAEAEPLYRRALAIDEASFGQDHPKVAIRLSNLAQLLRATNRLAEAEPLMRRALAVDEASFGQDHPNVAIRLNNLAQLLRATNRLAEAEPLMRRALAIWEHSLGKNHPKVATGLNNLAQLLRATNRLAEAEPLMRRALAIDTASFGQDHPSVAIRLSNLAALLQATNRLAEAEPLMRRALAIDEASFGPDHPNVATGLNNLAQLLIATSRLAEAEPLMRRHLEIFLNFTRATGYPNPHLQDAAGNYTGLLRDMGRSSEEIETTLSELGRIYGIGLVGAGGGAGNEPSPKLRAVLEEIMRDQSKLQEIVARLQKKDPELFEELVAFIRSQQE